MDASLFHPTGDSTRSFDGEQESSEVLICGPGANSLQQDRQRPLVLRHEHQPLSKSVNASAISQSSSTLGGPADKYRQAYLIDKPAAKRLKMREREMQLERDLKAQRQRIKALEDSNKQFV